MRILKDLEDQAAGGTHPDKSSRGWRASPRCHVVARAAGVADPNEFILSSLKKPVGPTRGEGWRLGVDRPTGGWRQVIRRSMIEAARIAGW